MNDEVENNMVPAKPVARTWDVVFGQISERIGGLDREATDTLWQQLAPRFQERWNPITAFGRKINAGMNPRLPSNLSEARRMVLNATLRLKLEEVPTYSEDGTSCFRTDREEIRSIDSAIDYLMMTHLSCLRPIKAFRNTSKDLRLVMEFLNEKFELKLSDQELAGACMGVTDAIRHYLKMDEGKQIGR